MAVRIISEFAVSCWRVRRKGNGGIPPRRSQGVGPLSFPLLRTCDPAAARPECRGGCGRGGRSGNASPLGNQSPGVRAGLPVTGLAQVTLSGHLHRHSVSSSRCPRTPAGTPGGCSPFESCRGGCSPFPRRSRCGLHRRTCVPPAPPSSLYTYL